MELSPRKGLDMKLYAVAVVAVKYSDGMITLWANYGMADNEEEMINHSLKIWKEKFEITHYNFNVTVTEIDFSSRA